MRIHEYQAKALFQEYGIAIPRGKVAPEAGEAGEIARSLGGRAIIKAQIHAGGRGKAGGIRLVSSPAEAEKAARELLGKRLATSQTKPEGLPVQTVLVEEAVERLRELYLCITVDEAGRCPAIIASAAGGVDIEEKARLSPRKVQRFPIDPATGLQPSEARRLADSLNLDQSLVEPAVTITTSLYRLFTGEDCLLVEINPLVVTTDGKLLALDARIVLDDNALFRHQYLAALQDLSQEEPREIQATQLGVRNYIKLEGNIGCMVNGAGLAMAVMDLIKMAGGSPANFLDIGTLNAPERVTNAFRVFTQDPEVKAVLVNIFGGMARVDIVARGIVEAYRQMEIHVPVVIRLAGTNVEEGKRILRESGIPYIEADDLAAAARQVVRAAGGAMGEKGNL
ncbi:MAG: ADP-forming succinate--CoA ligase subunit beta [Dehalococcoidia bacterium]|nr:ADP-forming succinate--CoA ligase subunit beta [Dehalococcoidia bacterium]